MISGFWTKLKRPIMALAPMANVTDCAFRRIIAKYGKPDVMFTEFVSCDGLMSPGRDKLLIDFRYTEAERPIVAQIFGSKPDNFYKTALLCQELDFDGIDINMGCPDKNVEKQGAGAYMMKNPKVAQKVVSATMRGAGKLPVSVKTRIGYNKNELATWLPALLNTELAAITVHCRTRKEMSLVPARWEHVAEAVALRDSSGSQTLILGNGDVPNLAEAEKKVAETGADGVMIGRGIFGNPWCFNRTRRPEDISLVERLRVMVEHTYLFEKLLGEHKNFDIMKKHYKAYVAGFNGAKELRIQLMEKAENAATVEEVVEKFIKYNLSS
ncbi:MAG: tRNA-dihydrouridine synthase [Candidatus Magasanikbacteria bacterium]|nr:tRNA-dihydrouridine synthase [Candidatus Magasanikbacteria bacterium]